MALEIFDSNVSLNLNQLLNFLIQNLSTAPTAGVLEGRTYYSTSDKTVYTWNGTSWLDLGKQGVTSFSAGNLPPLFTTTITNATTTPTLNFSLSNAAANTWFGNATGSSTTPSFNAAGALTATNDTNVTLTLGGSPVSALLKNVSLTLGWSGILGINRGGTGLGILGTTGQLIRVNAAGTALEYFTPSFGTGTVTSVGLSLPATVFGVTGSPVTSAGTLTASFITQTANTFFAAPNGSGGAPSFRVIVPNDLGTGTTNNTTFLRGDGTWFQLINDSTTTTTSTWSSQQISTAIANAMVGGMKYIGGYDASTNTPDLVTPAAGVVKQGYTYTVTVPGTFFGQDVEEGDMLIAEVNDPSSASDWTVVNRNIPAIVHATTSLYGITRYATLAEAQAGTATDLAISPATLTTILTSYGRYEQNFGNGSSTTFTITHNLGSKDVIVWIYENSSNTMWHMQVDNTSTTTVTISCNHAPTTNQFRAVIKL